ncbi:MAG: YeeE/YedE family protein [Bauldia sp.]|nr:YeeE/YedE family protein [Bauldia sp.]
MTEFTPLSASIGGALIGLSAGLLWLANGRTAGISGIFGGVMPLRPGDLAWRLVFLVALPIGAIIGAGIGPAVLSEISDAPPQLGLSPLVAIAAGLLVGAGTRIGGGCTSGHGICGLARFSVRSLVAVLTFMATAIVTVYVVRHVL